MKGIKVTNKELKFKKEKQKIIGVVGGLGPETTASFFTKMIETNRKKNKIGNPSIIVFNLPVTRQVENDLVVKGENIMSILPFLIDGVKKLEMAKVDFIVIPCNTVHVFIDDLRKISSVPIISIIEETSKQIVKKGFKKVGLLSTKQTIKSQLFNKELNKKIELICPSVDDQEKISKIIGNLLTNNIKQSDRNVLINIIEKFKDLGVEAVILGCTDLPLLIQDRDSKLPLINTLDILAEAAINKFLGGKNA